MPGQGLSCAVDIVMCIDVTASMAPILETVKSKALRVYPDLMAELDKKERPVDLMRVRVVAYRDVVADATPFETSDFFALPEQDRPFQEFVGRLRPTGGGDEPESGLEALAIAMGSKWTTECERQRHVIVVWTDASTHPLEHGASRLPPDVRNVVPRSFDDLTDMWESGQGGAMPKPTARRLVLFAPDSQIWNRINDEWNQVVHFASQAGVGLGDVDYNTIIDLLAGSIGGNV